MALSHFAPYRPGQDGPWNARAAAHLLRRAGFGAAPPEIERAVKAGPAASVQGLFVEAPEQEAEFQETFARINGAFVDFVDPAQLQAWWCYRMLRTRVPLREKLTLFWHGHFATNVAKVGDTYLMHRQCETLRACAWSPFSRLLSAIWQDPALLVYLDADSNTRENPNENFARELLELFTLGVGHYTEQDVREAARALTGLGRDGARFVVQAAAHDRGHKEFLGRYGRFDASDIVTILAQHPALPAFLARKLLVFFACPTPPAEVVAEAATLFARTGLDVRQFLHTLFLSKFFYGRACRRTRIASPAELVIGTCRSLGLTLPAQELRGHLADMGQELYAPPSVKGWDGETRWITSSTWAARTAFAQRVPAPSNSVGFTPALDVGQLSEWAVDPNRIVKWLDERLLEGQLSAARRAEVAQYLVSNEEGPQPELFRQDNFFREQQVRAAVTLLMSLPEYQTY